MTTTITAIEAQQQFFGLLDQTVAQKQIVCITHYPGNVILMSQQDYEGLLETLELLSSKTFRKTFQLAKAEAIAGDTLSFEEVFGESQ